MASKIDQGMSNETPENMAKNTENTVLKIGAKEDLHE